MILEVVQFLLESRDITTFTTYNLQIDVSQKKKKKKEKKTLQIDMSPIT